MRLPGPGLDRIARRRRGVIERLLHAPDGTAVHARSAQPATDRVVIGVRSQSREAAEWGLERMRRAARVDEDLSDFNARFRDDPLIGASVRAAPWLRPTLRPLAFEAFAWGVCEQLITFEEAVAIQRALARRFGRRCAQTGLRDVPTAAALAAAAPAELQACGLSAGRSVALRRGAIEVVRGRVDLEHGDHEAGWVRLRTISGIGSWTVEVLATHGQGRLDQLPAGDLAYRKTIGRLLNGGDPRARVCEDEVRAFMEPYAPYTALAGQHLLRSVGHELPHLGPQPLAA